MGSSLSNEEAREGCKRTGGEFFMSEYKKSTGHPGEIKELHAEAGEFFDLC